MAGVRASHSVEHQKERVQRIVKRLKRSYPEARTALSHANPLELLIATILSAQCTDERVNIVTKDLFKRYRSAKEYSLADRDELEQLIRSTGFYHAKANSILGCSKALVERFDGQVPRTMEELVSLPGVGRKTANVVLGNAYGIAAGVVVDTHVQRLSGRLGLSKEEDPKKIELDLMKILPSKEWILFPHLLILHGRMICSARKPKCVLCAIAGDCPSAGKV